MAKFIPSIRPEEFNNSYGEKQVYEALRTLDDRHTVFYSLSWVSPSDRRTIGEADFVVAHPEKGIVVIEVKAGGIAYKEGSWIQTNRATGESKTIRPFAQARKSQFELLERLEGANLGFRLPMLCYCVWFPSVTMAKASLPPEALPEITLDEESLSDPYSALDTCFSYWEGNYSGHPLSNYEFSRVIEVLCPHFNVAPRLRTQIAEAEESYIRLTRQQAALLDFLEEQRTAVIHGLAGTGKTVLAVEKAKRLAAQRQQVLFLCFNSFLRDALRRGCSIPGVTFHNAHSLAGSLHPMPGTPIEDVLAEFEEYLDVVYEAEDWPYTNVIVDEGQDLDDRLLNRLHDLVRVKGGCFYVFYDRNQFILGNELPRWIDEAECRLVLHKNCRNTAEVFRTSCALMGLSDVSYNEVHGERPAVSFYQTESELEAVVSSFIKRATTEGLSPEDVAILAMTSTDASWVDTERAYGGKSLSLERETGKVLFTTIRKFKGLEAEAVLIVDVSMLALRKAENRRLLYVGSSRAKHLLHIAMLEDAFGSDVADVISGINPDSGAPKNKRGLKRLLKMA